MKNYLKYWKISFRRPSVLTSTTAFKAFKAATAKLTQLATATASAIASYATAVAAFFKFWFSLAPEIAAIFFGIVIGCAGLYFWWWILSRLYYLA